MDTTEERRVAKRIIFREAVRYELKDPAHFRGSTAYDLSETGVRLRLTEFIPVNTEILMNIQLRDGSYYEYLGRISWISQIPFMDQYQAGVEFSKSDSLMDSKRKIIQLIHEN